MLISAYKYLKFFNALLNIEKGEIYLELSHAIALFFILYGDLNAGLERKMYSRVYLPKVLL